MIAAVASTGEVAAAAAAEAASRDEIPAVVDSAMILIVNPRIQVNITRFH